MLKKNKICSEKNLTSNIKIENLLYGINPIHSLIKRSPERIIRIFLVNVNNKLLNPKIKQIYDIAKQQGIALQEVKNLKTLDAWFNESVNHQGIIAHITPTKFLCENDLLDLVENNPAKNVMFLVLDHIQDPRNLGACIRNAAAFGVDAVILPKNRSCDLTPTVRKVASGGVDLVSIAKVNNLATCLKQLQAKGVWIISLGADHAKALNTLDLKIPLALVLGAEDSGVKNLIMRNSDFLAKIPMHNLEIDSLNLSVAAGICLYEVSRQREI